MEEEEVEEVRAVTTDRNFSAQRARALPADGSTTTSVLPCARCCSSNNSSTTRSCGPWRPASPPSDQAAVAVAMAALTCMIPLRLIWLIVSCGTSIIITTSSSNEVKTTQRI